MRTPITRPRKCSLAVRIRITAIEIMARLCANPTTIRHAIAAGMLCNCANTSSKAYHIAVAPIMRRATRMPPTRLSAMEPASEPTAKLADRYPSPVWLVP